MNLRPFLIGFEPGLYERLEQFRPTEAQMPQEYQIGHRSKRDDWAFFKDTTRIECARRFPLPLKVIEGPSHKKPILFDPKYPLSPGHAIFYMEVVNAGRTMLLPHVMADYGDYGLVKYAAFIDGEWRHVFTKFTMKTWFGKRFSAYWGCHQDLHVSLPDENNYMRSDLMGWIEPPTASWVKET